MTKGIMGSECSLLLVEVHGMSFWLKDKPQILVNEFFMVSPSTVLRHNELWSTWTECEIPLLIIRFIIASSMLLCFCTSTFLKTAVYPVTLWNWQSSHYTTTATSIYLWHLLHLAIWLYVAIHWMRCWLFLSGSFDFSCIWVIVVLFIFSLQHHICHGEFIAIEILLFSVFVKLTRAPPHSLSLIREHTASVNILGLICNLGTNRPWVWSEKKGGGRFLL